MKRLTKKNDDASVLVGIKYQFDTKKYDAFDCINKLGKLEDIEEKLGCPLEVREKAFGNGFYDENGNHYYCVHYVPHLKEMHTSGVMTNTHKRFKLVDYKITWWLKEDKSE